MIRRTSLALAAFAGVAALAGRAEAASIATYQLKNTGTAAVTQVVAAIGPAGSIPSDTAANPFSVITTPSGPDGKSVSGGFDMPAAGAPALDTVGTGKLANGDPLEVLKLQFDTKGFAPGAILNFSLNLGTSSSGPAPTLLLEDPTTGLSPAGLSLVPFTAPTPTTPAGTSTGSTIPTAGGGTTVPTANVPEPVSIALWSVAAGLSLLRARAFRRARQIEG